jgi:transposase
MTLMDIDRYRSPSCGASLLANRQAKTGQTEQRAVIRVLTVNGLRAKEKEMELASMYGYDALQISAVKKWRTRFVQGRTELGDDPRSGRPANSDLKE